MPLAREAASCTGSSRAGVKRGETEIAAASCTDLSGAGGFVDGGGDFAV